MVAAFAVGVVAVLLFRGHGPARLPQGSGTGAGTGGGGDVGVGASPGGKAGDGVHPLDSTTAIWRDFDGVSLPTSAAGPHRVEGGRAFGFDRSPDGAVLAAIHIFSRASALYGPQVFEPTIAEQVTGSDKAQFLSTVEGEYATDKSLHGVGPRGEITYDIETGRREQAGPWAYRLDGFDPSLTNVHVLLRSVPMGSSPVYVDMAFAIKWAEDDWRLTAPLNGQWTSISRQLTDIPAGYTVIGRA